VPPVYAAPRTFTPPPAAETSKPLPPLAIVGIIVGALVVVGAIVAAVAFVINQVGAAFEDEDFGSGFGEYSELEQLLAGEASGPTAVNPTECDTECFGTGTARVVIPSDVTFEQFGFADDYSSFVPSNTVDNELAYNTRDFQLNYGTPDSCLAVWASSPITQTLVSPTDPQRQTIDFADDRYDEDYGATSFSQSMRLFPDSADAESHMLQLDTEIDGCSSYNLYDPEYPSVYEVTPAPALEVPDNVAVLGWVESSEYDRSYTFELQRGNLVVRTEVTTDGMMSEQKFRDLVAIVAEQLGDARIG
jgi:hypothetical protein